MKTPWQVAVAQARMAHFGQRAYVDMFGTVRFYPSYAMREGGSGGGWRTTIWKEEVCIERGDTHITEAEARAIWDTRPEGMK